MLGITSDILVFIQDEWRIPMLRTLLFSTVVTLASLNSASAATLNLNPGDTVTLIPNVQTTVVCGTSSTLDCQRDINMMIARFNTCKKSYPASTCFNNEWPAFKQRSPRCVMDAFDTCVEMCEETYPSSTCYNNCR